MKSIAFCALFALASCGSSAGNLPDVEQAAAREPERSSTPMNPTIADLLRSSAFTGNTVTASGTCLGYAKRQAIGNQPRTRSDWQLADSTGVIWVVGTFLPGCAPSGGDGLLHSVRAVVAEDTLINIVSSEKQPRRYLVIQ
jgi:hypothetical protein